MKSEQFNILKRSAVMALVLLVFAGGSGLASAAYSFLPVVESDTVDYYRGYGEPALNASLKGSTEFGKGDNATLQITLSNSGTIEKIIVNKSVGDLSNRFNYEVGPGSNGGIEIINASELADYLSQMNTLSDLSSKEMGYETARVHAADVSATLVSPTSMIDIPSGTELVHVSSLPSGGTTTLSFPININKNIESGSYSFDLIVNYRFQDNVLMYKSANGTELLTTFLTTDDCVKEYADRKVVLPVEIVIRSEPVFKVTNVDGTLVSGKTKTVSVTYTNVGDAVAYGAESKLSLMNPLTSSSNKAYLGDVAPGESVTVPYVITAGSDAIDKIYGVSSDIRYYDDNDDLQISSAMKVDIGLSIGKSYLTPENVLLAVFAGCLLYGLYMAAKRIAGRSKSKEN